MRVHTQNFVGHFYIVVCSQVTLSFISYIVLGKKADIIVNKQKKDDNVDGTAIILNNIEKSFKMNVIMVKFNLLVHFSFH